MLATTAATLGSVACLGCVALLLLPAVASRPWARALAKLGASSCFVLVAVALGGLASAYGRWMLGGLALAWLGDALLLSRRSPAFMAGLGAFLLAHLFYTAGFLVGGLSTKAMAGSALTAQTAPIALAALVALAFGTAVLRWLAPHLPPRFRLPVIAYVVAILTMCIAATAYAFASGSWLVLLGAVLFAASDLAVARERFVAPSAANPRWGLPSYYLAQLLLAGSVAAHAPPSAGSPALSTAWCR